MSPDDLKKYQLSIILKTNPAPNQGAVWIRELKDIKSLQEIYYNFLEGDGGAITPDYTGDDIKKALQLNKIKIYSSHKITPGVFVTPSKIEAQNYAGDGPVYSEMVNINTVAWLDAIEGQFCGL